MRSFVYIAVLLLFFASCSNQYELEDRICDCLESYVDIESSSFYQLVAEIENEYRESGRFNVEDESAFINLAAVFSSEYGQNISHTFSTELETNLSDLFQLFIESGCVNEAQQWDDESVYKTFSAKMISALKNGNRNLWRHFELELDAEDYQHPLFKSLFFISDYSEHSFFRDFGPLLPNKTQEIPADNSIGENNKLRIELIDDNQIFVNNALTKLSELEVKVRWFYTANSNGQINDQNMPLYDRVDSAVCKARISELELEPQQLGKRELWEEKMALCAISPSHYFYEISPMAVVQLISHLNTTYGTYINVQNVLKQVVNDLRIIECDKYGFPHYFDLQEDKEEDMVYIKMLRILVPERIIESKIQE